MRRDRSLYVPKSLLIISVMLLLMSQLQVFISFGEPSAAEAISTLDSAEVAVVSAYRWVLNAEDVGANVSALLAELNEAGQLLAEAHLAYSLGNLGESVRLADSGKSIAESVEDEALKLRNSAFSSGLLQKALTMIGSAVGIAAIALGSYWGWSLLKKRNSTEGLRTRQQL